jgi:hypothetical protein
MIRSAPRRFDAMTPQRPTAVADDCDRLAGLYLRRDRFDRHIVGADGVDDADELMTHPPARIVAWHRLVRPQVAAADRGACDSHDGVARLDQPRIGNVFDANITRFVHQCCAQTPKPRIENSTGSRAEVFGWPIVASVVTRQFARAIASGEIPRTLAQARTACYRRGLGAVYGTRAVSATSRSRWESIVYRSSR